MERYIRKIKHVKVLIIIAAVGFILVAITFVILVAAGLNWLLSRGDDLKQAGETVAQQVQPAATLNLASYIDGSTVDTQQLEQLFAALPTQLRDAWLEQLKAQIDQLQSQAGISDETIQTLTALYESLVTLQN